MTVPIAVSLPPEGRSAGHARAHVRRTLADAGLSHLESDALLLVTELVTNAVVHAGTDVEVRLQPVGAGRLRGEVLDHSPGALPVLRPDAEQVREGGRGLFLLDALASEWGITHTRTGKSVWFLLGGASQPAPSAAPPLRLGSVSRPDVDITWLLALPADREERLSTRQLVTELVHRLCDALDVDEAVLVAEDGSDPGRWDVVAYRGEVPGDDVVADTQRQAGSVTAPLVETGDRILLPLRADGATFAALALRAPDLDPARTAVARLVADRLAMLLRDERAEATHNRERGSLALLAEASDLFAATLDVQLAVTLACQLVVPRFAHWAAVYTTSERGVGLAAVAHADETRTSPLRVALSGTAGTAFAERLARELQTQRPALVGTTDLAGVLGPDERPGDVLALPLVARRRLLGGLLVARPVGSRYAPEDVTLLLDLARRAALAVDNARLYEERTAIAHALQASLLPPDLPTAREVDFGARYLPAGEGNEVGGDFYDVFGLPDGGWVLAIGDVCGKGAEAAAITGLARNVLRLLLREGRSPADAFRRLNDAILELGERGRFCTAALAVVHAEEGGLVVRMSSAGHPPPAVVRSDGTTSFVGRSGTVLGVLAVPELADDVLRLGAGDALVLYTDGVTERRRGARMFGEETLLASLRRTAGRSADGVASAIEQAVREFGPDVARDDLAVLVARATGLASAAPEAEVAQLSL